jgi:hypothetical protein
MSAPEGEVTAAVWRGAVAVPLAYTQAMTDPTVPHVGRHVATNVLDAALDVEEMARVISSHRHGSEVPWPEDRRTAEALRAAILGGAA